jgi:D-alanine-D-alanine ligase
MHIEIVTTPNESLKESGFGSIKACESVLDAIKRMGLRASLNICKTKNDLDDIVKRKPDLVILAVKYLPAIYNDKFCEKEIWLSDYFARHDINFTGSTRETLKFDSNKVLAKTHLKNKGIKTANYFLATPGKYKAESELPIPFPLFLKPLDAANGNGIDDLSFVHHFTDYENKIASLYKTYTQPILVEEYLDGREFTVSLIKTSNTKLVVSAVEVIPPTSTHGLRILGSQAKKDNSEELIEIVDEEVSRRVRALAINAFTALGVRDYGRIDIKTDNHGECYFMEANLVPGMTYGSSYFPMACKIAHELSYDKVIKLLLTGGLARTCSTVPPTIYPDSDKKTLTIM